MKKYLILAIVLILILIAVLIFRNDVVAAWNTVSITFGSPEKIRSFVMSFGYFAPIVFLTVQVAQVIVAPIPGNVTTILGGTMFGAVEGTILNCTGILLGSVLAFLLARVFGKPLVIKLVGEQIYEKYGKIFNKKGVVALFLIFLFPFFPDDALCLLAGLSPLPFATFLLLIITGRVPGTIAGTLVGSGMVRFNTMQWIVIALVSIAFLYIAIKYGSKIEDWLYKKLNLNRKAV